jgi:hypothetical protein
MDLDTDMFVQAFWTKCREVIRPEVDTAIEELAKAGHEARVSTQEYTAVPDGLPADTGPSLTVALRPHGSGDDDPHPHLHFHADVKRSIVEVTASSGEPHRYDLDALHAAEVRNEIDEWLGKLLA